MKKSKYSTKQRELLIKYLSEHIDEQVSTYQIANELQNSEISLSAIYRNLSDLEKDGLVKMCIKKNSREVYYQYIATDECKNSIHLTCRMCGKSFHMDANDAEILLLSVKLNNGFTINKSLSTLYGICENCSEQSNSID